MSKNKNKDIKIPLVGPDEIIPGELYHAGFLNLAGSITWPEMFQNMVAIKKGDKYKGEGFYYFLCSDGKKTKLLFYKKDWMFETHVVQV